MKSKLKEIGIDIALLIVILILLLTFHAVFIAGPKRAMEHEDALFAQTFIEAEKLENAHFENRFSLSSIYYIVSDKTKLYYFDQDFEDQGFSPYVSLETAYPVAERLGFSPKQVSYGVFNNQIVFSLEKKNTIVFLDLESLEMVFEFGGDNHVVE